MIDFINYWDSSFNREKRTKDNTLCLIRNFLSFTDNDLIQFLDKNDIFFLISKNFIREFNNDNQNKITLDDIYKIIYETISCIDNNLYFFVYTLVILATSLNLKTSLFFTSEIFNSNKLTNFAPVFIDKVNNIKSRIQPLLLYSSFIFSIILLSSITDVFIVF